VLQGSEVTIHYDPLLAKLIVWGEDRPQALRRLRRALGELRIEGIRTTAPLFLDLLEDEDFLAGRLDIGMLDRKLQSGDWPPRRTAGEPGTPSLDSDLSLIAAAICHLQRAGRSSGTPVVAHSARRRWHAAARGEALRRPV
jgi:acetyl/propionyl-CoA carboxylase alpha subunit